MLTVNENDRFLDGVLVTELGIQESTGNKGAIVRGLIPADMEMVNIDMAKTTHHFHLILNWRGEREREKKKRGTIKHFVG